MAVPRRIFVLLAIAAAALALTSCTRKITRIEQQPRAAETCFACHSDTTTFLLAADQQWQHSQHATGSTLAEGQEGTCGGCHASEGFVARSLGQAVVPVENPTAIGCFTCHAPHTNGDFRLRWTQLATLENGVTYDLHAGNTCAACHHGRRNVNTYITARTTLSSRFGPHHGPQGDMLLGGNGYEYSWYVYEQTAHRSALANGCLDCHFKVRGGNVLGGHSFNMTYAEGADTLMNTAACEPCHGTVASFDVHGAQTEVDSLVNVLQTDLIAAGLLSSTGSPKSVTTSADSAGAVWNLISVKEDRSHGVHNFGYIRSLLLSSIQYITGGAPGGTPARASVATRMHRRRR